VQNSLFLKERKVASPSIGGGQAKSQDPSQHKLALAENGAGMKAKMLAKLQGLEPLTGGVAKSKLYVSTNKSANNQRQISPSGVVMPASAGIALSPYDEEFSTLEAQKRSAQQETLSNPPASKGGSRGNHLMNNNL
jgi:hypothetical protein